jgi:hypothetical protein
MIEPQEISVRFCMRAAEWMRSAWLNRHTVRASLKILPFQEIRQLMLIEFDRYSNTVSAAQASIHQTREYLAGRICCDVV